MTYWDCHKHFPVPILFWPLVFGAQVFMTPDNTSHKALLLGAVLLAVAFTLLMGVWGGQTCDCGSFHG